MLFLLLKQRSEAEGWDVLNWATTEAELNHLLDRDIRVLSGGELQRFAISVVAVQMSDVYMFDEPSSYLDVKQRLTAAAMIREILESKEGYRRYVLVVEHDLAVLDYLSDFVCVLYGTAGAYGVVTMPMSVRMGINAFLAGFLSSENLRFRDHALTFKVSTRCALLVTLSFFFASQIDSHKLYLLLFYTGLGTRRSWRRIS